MSYFGSIINNSATIIAKASAKITDGAFLAATLTENGVAVAKASETPIGIMVAETGTVEAGEEVTIQVKDIGLAKVGAAVNAGDILAADANGKLIKAPMAPLLLRLPWTRPPPLTRSSRYRSASPALPLPPE